MQHVYGVDDATVDLICEQTTWTIDPDVLRGYKEKTNNQTELYPIFTEIAEDLIPKVRALVNRTGKAPSRSSVVFWSKDDTCKIKSRFTRLQPDMLTLAEMVDRPVWLMPWQVFEFEKERKLDGERKRAAVASSTSSALPSVPKSGLASSGQSSGRPRKQVPSANRSPSADPVRRSARIASCNASGPPGYASTRYSSPPPSRTTGQKRKNIDSETANTRPTKRRTIDYTQDELQLATYALECMTSSTRLYTAGIFIDRTFLSLWCYDSACMIRTKSFSFEEYPAALALVIYALTSACDHKHAGFDPHMEIHHSDALQADASSKSMVKAAGVPCIVCSRIAFPLGDDGDVSLGRGRFKGFCLSIMGLLVGRRRFMKR